MKNNISKSKRLKVYGLYNGKCALCGRDLHIDTSKYQDNNYMQVDHIIPKSLGGNDDIENLRAVCRSCNSIRGNYTGEILKQRIIKTFIENDLTVQKHNYNRLIDDINNGFISDNDLQEIYNAFVKSTLNNISVFKALNHKLTTKEVGA